MNKENWNESSHNELIDDLIKAALVIKEANKMINFYGGHGDTTGMKQIFNTINTIQIQLEDFTKTHGTGLN